MALSVNDENINDNNFLQQLAPNEEPFTNFVSTRGKYSYYLIADQIANRILARCLIFMNRLYEGKDEEYEQRIIYHSLRCLKCRAMNPKHSAAAYLHNRKELCD